LCAARNALLKHGSMVDFEEQTPRSTAQASATARATNAKSVATRSSLVYLLVQIAQGVPRLLRGQRAPSYSLASVRILHEVVIEKVAHYGAVIRRWRFVLDDVCSTIHEEFKTVALALNLV
jgi:hypothetical protein